MFEYRHISGKDWRQHMKNKMRYYLAVAAVVIAAVIGVDKGTLSALIREAVQMGEYAAEE